MKVLLWGKKKIYIVENTFLSSVGLFSNDLMISAHVLCYPPLLSVLLLRASPHYAPTLPPPSPFGQTLPSAPLLDRAWNFPTCLWLTLHQNRTHAQFKHMQSRQNMLCLWRQDGECGHSGENWMLLVNWWLNHSCSLFLLVQLLTTSHGAH